MCPYKQDFLNSFCPYCANPVEFQAQYLHVLYFSLIWNRFEDKCFSKGTWDSLDKISIDLNQKCQTNPLTWQENILIYFKNRYITNENTNQLFNGLEFCTKEDSLVNQRRENFVKNVLLDDTKNYEERIKALLYIIYRIRNNLFHGTKTAQEILDQRDMFEKINEFLVKVIELYLR